MSAQTPNKPFQSEYATTNDVRRSTKYVQNILKNQNNQEISSFC